MRGKVRACSFEVMQGRITPAYAGKRCHTLRGQQTGRDHPRLCGEKAYIDNVPQINPGSPPPMRGKVHAIATLCRCDGITPAYAGKSKLLF